MRKIRAVIVGYGNIGKYTLQALNAAPDFEVAGIVRRSGAENLPAEMVGMYMQYMAWEYEVVATDATSGVIRVFATDHFGDVVSSEGTYTDWNGTTCVVNLDVLMLSDVTMTVSEEVLPVYIEQMM